MGYSSLVKENCNRKVTAEFMRSAEIVRSSKAARTFEIALSSESPVTRDSYVEVLSHDPQDIDMSRLNASAPFLVGHDQNDQVGVVEPGSARIGLDKILRCSVRMSRSKRAEEIWQDIQDGIRKSISVGYSVTSQLSSAADQASGLPIIRWAWTPFEASTVACPADLVAGVGRSMSRATETSTDDDVCKCPCGWSGDCNDTEGICPECGKNLNCDHAPRGISSATFYEILDNMKKQEPATTRLFGLTEMGAQQFSIVRAIRDTIATGHPCGFEKEMFDEGRKVFGSDITGQIFVPPDLLVGIGQRDPLMRDLTAASGQGSQFVSHQIVTPIIQLLRAKLVVGRAGGQFLGGLSGMVSIPRQTGPATPYVLTEQARVTPSTQSIDSVNLTPHRISAATAYSKQLFVQSSVDIEQFLRQDLAQVLAVQLDQFALCGPGGGSPLGVLSTTGVAAVNFGAAATFSKLLDFERALSNLNADVIGARLGWVTSPDTKIKWKQTPIVAGFPDFLWKGGSLRFPDSDGEIANGSPGYSTSNMPDRVIFANWQDLLLAMWGSIDITIDPYTSAPDGKVNVILNAYVDSAVRRPASFAASSDSGAQ